MSTTRPPTAIVLLNLGGPADLEQVGGFLQRLFADREIIKLPLQRWLGPFIASRRTPKVKRLYAGIGGGSPILRWTETQGRGMCERLDQLSPETAPILLPGDLLFEYDAYRLQPGAISSMQKLGQLLLRTPRSRFLIEGHSDSFGPDDYNLRLSELRAQTVKEWLISSMGIPADSIETRGFGESRLVAPATGSIEEQQINRRVEIVIRPPAP
jgi:outer membrane protein OmpA-like peptidoglycan-associated protein